MLGSRLLQSHFDRTGRTNIAEGIPDLADAIGLGAELPADLPPTLAALFRYRNSMFHQSFEWSESERAKFAKATAAWPAEWFSHATSGGEPWVFYRNILARRGSGPSG